ncbi:Crp/Fnr family transcriptional regulator [uncultured Finegoldia sp.]|uniref:Crp/Fnr family transcriptional regulator n=1 Tax=uncultured Finegoldia sp. TaxID=328009 RepID=UPI00262D4E29|nr:Crp/Fnr family transcriptional regulator [uncultured Finegoldia sp.]
MIESKLFKNFTDEDFEQFMMESKSVVKNYNKNSDVFSPGDVCDKIYVIKSGKLSLEKTDINGKNTVVNIFKNKGDVMAEVYAYLNKISDFTLVCNTDCEILEIPVRYFDMNGGFSDVKNKVMTNIITILAEKAFFLNSKVRLLSSFSLRQKIATFLVQTQKDGISNTEMTRQQMADFMATTRPSLSRELLNMQDSGLIELKGSKIMIVDIEQLKNLL